MLIATISDIHSPRKYEEFLRALERFNASPDLFLMAGDIVYRGDIAEYEKIYNALFGKISCPIVACFGNNEYPQIRVSIEKRLKDIKFLDDSSTVLNIKGFSVGIFGTTGSLDTATPWQKANIPNIENVFQHRLLQADYQLGRMDVDFKIFISHYSPTYKTLLGENPSFYSSLGSKAYENILIKRKTNLAIHGHSNRGLKFSWVDLVPVFNVCFSVNREIVVIDTEKDLKHGISKFF